MYEKQLINRLEHLAAKFRIQVIRMISHSQSGHLGGSLSALDLITSLYFYKMRIDVNNPNWQERDYFILSKGHAAPALYTVLAERGFIEYSSLATLRELGSQLQGHAHHHIPGVEFSTGPLGIGLSLGLGTAIGLNINNIQSNVYVMLGDGELNEGQIWEAAMAAAHFKVGNLIAIIDRNHIQMDDYTNKIMDTNPLDEKWRSFGWNVVNIDGHDFEQILCALDDVDYTCPTVIIAETTKGKGVTFIEDKVEFHSRPLNQEQTVEAISELITLSRTKR